MKKRTVLRYLDGDDKITLLGKVLDLAGFDEAVEHCMKQKGRNKKNLRIVIKPNASMFIRRDENGITTDPMLVLALVERLLSAGFEDVTLVESSNLYEAGFRNREVIRVMAEQGMAGGYAPGEVTKETQLVAYVLDRSGSRLPYKLVDLGSDMVRIQTNDMPCGFLDLGRTWAEADFRVSFCAFKTHLYDGYTLLVKNTYGCLPHGNKMWHYHHKTGAAKPAVVQLGLCPVHFGIIDGIYGSDGLAGVKWGRVIPPMPGFILAGENIVEAEKAACLIMGVDYRKSYMSRLALQGDDRPPEIDGEVRPLQNWSNVPGFVVPAVAILERYYYLHRFVQMMTDFFGSKPFTRTPAGVFFTALSILGIVPISFFAYQKRHWWKAAGRRLYERMKVFFKGASVERALANDLFRLKSRELSVLQKIIEEGGNGKVEIYGHKLLRGDRVYGLPWSDFFSIDRIRKLADAVSGNTLQGKRLVKCITLIQSMRKASSALNV